MSATSLLSDAEIASYANGIYAYPGYDRISWDHFEEPQNDNGICWALKGLNGIDLIVFRGSTTPEDWARDFDAFANPFEDSFLGPVHPGFMAGMEDAWRAIKSKLSTGYIAITGHSLGAARARIASGIMIRDGILPVLCTTFGEPRPGFSKLASITKTINGQFYQNGNGVIVDPVTEVPLAIWPLAYCHDRAPTCIDVPPTGAAHESFGLMGWHSSILYLEGCERAEGRPSSLKAALSKVPDLLSKIASH